MMFIKYLSIVLLEVLGRLNLVSRRIYIPVYILGPNTKIHVTEHSPEPRLFVPDSSVLALRFQLPRTIYLN